MNEFQVPVCRRCFERGHETNECKEAKENFELIGPIAEFIGARLQHPYPTINGQGNPWTSTISVDQYKEKFWYVRVYCKLADPDLVQRKWMWLKDRQRRLDGGEKIYCHPSSKLVAMLAEFSDEAPPDFFARCALHDAIHYREVYMDAVRLRPHLRERICDQADYNVLLGESVDKIDIKPENVKWNCKKFHVANEDDLLAFIKKVYDPTFENRSDLRD